MFEILEIFRYLYFFALHIGGTGTFPKALSKDEERECLEVLKRAREHSMQGKEKEVKSARDRLISHNLRLVAHVIKKYYASYCDQDDLISIGTIGLIKGINSFDPDKGTKLATYACRCIENEILMYFRSLKSKQQYVLMGDSIETDHEGNALTIMDVVCDDCDIERDTEIKLKAQQAIKLTERLEPREREIITLRYGLNNNPPLTQREVAERLSISRSYVSRIEKKALETLRLGFSKDG